MIFVRENPAHTALLQETFIARQDLLDSFPNRCGIPSFADEALLFSDKYLSFESL